jgi:hypothetical protein
MDNTGLVTPRHQGSLYHIGIGRPHIGTRVKLLVQDLHIHVVNAVRAHPQPRQALPAHRPPIRLAKENTATLMRVRGVLDVLRHHMSRFRAIDPT